MAKPIFVARFYNGQDKESQQATLAAIRRELSSMFNNEYHVLISLYSEPKEASFEVLNAENLEPITKETFANLVSECEVG